jgi:hypothetical protein
MGEQSTSHGGAIIEQFTQGTQALMVSIAASTSESVAKLATNADAASPVSEITGVDSSTTPLQIHLTTQPPTSYITNSLTEIIAHCHHNLEPETPLPFHPKGMT